MKQKILATRFALLIAAIGNGQEISMKNDTVYYQNQTFYEGKEIKLGYGSSSNKNFAFINWGTGMGGYKPLPATWAKNIVLIEKVYMMQGKYYFKGKLKEVKAMGTKLIVDIEAAIDNKELMLE